MEKRYSRSKAIIGFELCLMVAVIIFFLPETAWLTPPEYKTFGRKQQTDYVYEDMDLLRIWVVYVGQGDGILIQLPKKYNYDPNPEDGIDAKSERNDILIDGGSHRSTNAHLMGDFLQRIYDPARIIIENAIITHHDSDHILGLTAILKEPAVSVDHIYHNGLASYRYEGRIKTAVDSSKKKIVKKTRGQINRVLAVLETDGKTIEDNILVNDIRELEKNYSDGLLQGLYENLAGAILGKQAPTPVVTFSRAWAKGAFMTNRTDISFTVLWPRKKLKAYSGWGQTINGNSVTFLLKYRDFEMLFTGDQNQKSEAVLIDHLKNEGNASMLHCDVLKAPHHGSDDNIETFIRPDGVPAVLTVASMGKTGFSDQWKHPSTQVIKWAGGFHRFYSTYIHEKKFNWPDMLDAQKRSEMEECNHILIETDGRMFRLVEIDAGIEDLNNPPPVCKVSRSNGTRWINAKP